MVRFLFYGFYAYVFDLHPDQAKKFGRPPSLHPELQEPPLTVVCGGSLFRGPRLEVKLGVLDGSEEVYVAVVVYYYGRDYQGRTSFSRDTRLPLQATRCATRRGSCSRDCAEGFFH